MIRAFEKLKASLARTKDQLVGKITQAVARRKLDDDLLEQIEEILIEADVGVVTTAHLIERLKQKAAEQNLTEGDAVIGLLKQEITAILESHQRSITASQGRPEVWLIVGVNGVGKTTTIGKLATTFSRRGKKVLIAACDTFRAAAIDQVEVWAERSGVQIVRSHSGSDPAAVAFDAAKAAQARGCDMVLVDTAGRIHTKTNLMEELKKIRRVIERALPQAAIFSKLIVDGSTGQNALSQVRIFSDAVGCDGIIVTKLDGTARGGVVIAVAAEMQVPVDFIGVGEGLEDLQPFDPREFTEALFA